MWAAAARPWGLPRALVAPPWGPRAALLPAGARGLRGSPAPRGQNPLKKSASRTRKKFWYEGPSLGSHLMYKPSRLDFLTKTTAKKPRRDDHVRLRALNGLLYKALMDLLCTPEVSQEICDLDVQLSKAPSDGPTDPKERAANSVHSGQRQFGSGGGTALNNSLL